MPRFLSQLYYYCFVSDENSVGPHEQDRASSLPGMSSGVIIIYGRSAAPHSCLPASPALWQMSPMTAGRNNLQLNIHLRSVNVRGGVSLSGKHTDTRTFTHALALSHAASIRRISARNASWMVVKCLRYLLQVSFQVWVVACTPYFADLHQIILLCLNFPICFCSTGLPGLHIISADLRLKNKSQLNWCCSSQVWPQGGTLLTKSTVASSLMEGLFSALVAVPRCITAKWNRKNENRT